MKNCTWIILLLITLACDNNSTYSQLQHDGITVIDTHDFLRDFHAFTTDSLVNMVIEIPAGCNQKWEVDKETGFLEWERRGEDSLRVVKYLPYPANYGMVPSTWLPEDQGGDNDPVDVFLLGLRAERGELVPVRIIGVIRMLDKGLQDDKLIAVTGTDWFHNIYDIFQLMETYPGIMEILTTWLANYKGPGLVEFQEIENAESAMRILHHASRAYLSVDGVIKQP